MFNRLVWDVRSIAQNGVKKNVTVRELKGRRSFARSVARQSLAHLFISVALKPTISVHIALIACARTHGTINGAILKK